MLYLSNAPLILIIIDISQYHKSTLIWKIIFVECPSIGGQGGPQGLMQLLCNSQWDFFKHMSEDARCQACKSQEMVVSLASGYSAFSCRHAKGNNQTTSP